MAALCKEAPALCGQLEWMHVFSGAWPGRDCLPVVLTVNWVRTVHIWITASFLPGAILDCYSLQASHAVTGTNWFNHQLLWSLKLLKVLAKLMNCNWMWNESLSPFPTISYQRLLYPCKVTGRRFRLGFNNGPCQRIELHSLWQTQLQFAFHTLLYKICIQLIHWIIGILWVSKEFTEWFVLKIHGILSIWWLLGRDNERIPWFFTACRRTHFFLSSDLTLYLFILRGAVGKEWYSSCLQECD